MPVRSGYGSNVPRLVLIDSDPSTGALVEQAFAGAPVPPSVHSAPSGRQAMAGLRAAACDLVLADLRSLNDLGVSTEDAVARLVKLAEGALLIAISDGASVSAAVAAMRAGAHDFIARPLDGAGLRRRIGDLAWRFGREDILPCGPPPQRQADEPVPAALAAPTPPQGILPMWQQEQRIIEEAIASFSGNIALAAAALQISPSTIYRKRQSWSDLQETGT